MKLVEEKEGDKESRITGKQKKIQHTQNQK